MTSTNEHAEIADTMETTENALQDSKDKESADTSRHGSMELTLSPTSAKEPTSRESVASPQTSTAFTFPKAFYCPLTNELLQDPVVALDGLSYERAALEARGDDLSKHYENRALKSIITEAVEYRSSSSLKRLQHSVRQFSQQLINEYHRPLPDAYYCPITLGLIHMPVIDPEGYSYEKVAIENWIRCNGASPVTRQPMAIEELYPNRTLAALMEEETGKSDDLMHPSFKEWKNEPAPTVGIVDLERGSAHGTATIPFPSTPEELEEANRRRRARRYRRLVLWLIVIGGLLFLAWTIPVISTLLLVLILAGIGIVAGYSSRSSPFRGP